jgi:hypothetical protein
MDGFDRMFGQTGAPDADDAVATASARGRDSLLLVATIQLGDDPTVEEVRIRNLSAGGMMAEYPGRVAVGTPVALDLRGIGRVTGQVAWCTQGRIGIALDRPIDPKRARKPVAGGTGTPHYAKSALEIRPRRR